MGTPSVAYKQAHSPAPKIKGSLQGLQSTVRYRVEWADAFTFANEVLGLLDGNPWKWPASPNMRATEANIEPIAIKDTPDTGGGSVPGTYYRWAYVDVTFSSITSNLAMTGTAEQPPANQFDAANPIEMSSFQIQYASEMIKIPNGTLKWADTTNIGANQILPISIRAPESGAYYMRVPTFNLNITLHNCLYVQASNFAEKVGKVNSATMFGTCDPETVLFDGVNTSRREMSDGTAILDVTLNYKWRKSGWNVAMGSNGYLYQYSKIDGKLVYERDDILPLTIISPAQRWYPAGGRNGWKGA